MISFLFLCLTISASTNNLMTTIRIYAGFTKKKVQQYREEKQKEYDEQMEECKTQGDYMINFCELMHEAFKPQNIITEDEVEETIRRIDYYSILIMSFGYQGKIDLNQLKSHDAVVSIGLYPSTGSLPSSIQN